MYHDNDRLTSLLLRGYPLIVSTHVFRHLWREPAQGSSISTTEDSRGIWEVSMATAS